MIQFVFGFICGQTLTIVAALCFSRRVISRWKHSLELEVLSDNLEKRRAAHDLGRDEAIRPGAGVPGQEANLFPVRPGKLVLNRLQEKRVKRAKDVDTQQDSAMINESGSNQTDNKE